jgi:hypothetical protein
MPNGAFERHQHQRADGADAVAPIGGAAFTTMQSGCARPAAAPNGGSEHDADRSAWVQFTGENSFYGQGEQAGGHTIRSLAGVNQHASFRGVMARVLKEIGPAASVTYGAMVMNSVGHEGGCHCGNCGSAALVWRRQPPAAPIACSFAARTHYTIADPAGLFEVTAEVVAGERYRFGTATRTIWCAGAAASTSRPCAIWRRRARRRRQLPERSGSVHVLPAVYDHDGETGPPRARRDARRAAKRRWLCTQS